MRKITNKRPTIGVLAGIQVYYGTILGNFIGPLLHGVTSAAEKRHCNLLLSCGMDSSSYTSVHPAWPEVSPDVDFLPVGPWNTDGLIVVNPLFSEAKSRYVRDLLTGGHPIVYAATGEQGPTVAIDNTGAIRQALLHLIDHGHRRIAFVAGYPDDITGDSGTRLNAYLQFVQDHGLPASPNLIAFGRHGINGGQEAMQQILAAGASFSAVLASNDESAIGAMNLLKSRGIRIPEDVAVIGIDDTTEAVTQIPALTTFHNSPFRMGYRALELLLDFIEDPGKKLDSITVPMQFVVRDSCGCRAGQDGTLKSDPDHTPASGRPAAEFTSRLASPMAEIALAGTERFSPGEVRFRCRHLAATFIESLLSGNHAGFQNSLEGTLQRVEALEDDAYVWNDVIRALQGGLGLIRAFPGLSAMDEAAAVMLAEARATISRHMQRQHRRLISHQKWIADQVGQLNARLLTALDEAQVYEILASYLPQIGIRHVGVAFFEPDEGDPVARSRLRKVSERTLELNFPSRAFPPDDLYDDPFRLVLLPMAGRDELPGYAVFDASDLEICAPIVWQLVTFLKVVRLYREATHGRQLAEEANRLKSRFLSTVSHELRTPLNLIVGLSEMLLVESHTKGPQSERDLKRIHASARHLDGLIRDVLDLAHNEMGELKLMCEPVEIADVLGVVAAVGEQLAADKGLDWQLFIPDDLPMVWGDKTRLRQVVLNLVNNAVKFTRRGGVSVRVGSVEDRITIEVSDTGLGIQPEDQTVIFDEFRQSERTTMLGYGGLGLGLAICRRLVSLHGGSIGVHSTGGRGEGSTFYVTLPVMGHGILHGIAGTDTPERAVLLLAERSPEGDRLQEYLTRQGFVVERIWIDAANQLLPSWLRAQPGAVLLEQGIAASVGWELMRTLKESPQAREIPILVYSLDGNRNRGSVLDLNTLSKPLHNGDLVLALYTHLSREGEAATGKSILIVDDDPPTLELHARMVRDWSPGCRIYKAADGRIALDIMETTRPDLVLLDLGMPELDGFGVLEAMRSDPVMKDIPVIILTGQSLRLEDVQAFGRSVTAVLNKGLFSSQETLSHIQAALERSPRLGTEARRIVRKAVLFLHEHYMDPISLEDAARHVSLSKEHLARCFRQEMGLTLVTYLNRYRIERAKTLLEKSNMSLTDVALESGFSGSAYFSRIFRREEGVSPASYRRTGKANRASRSSG